MFFLYIFLVLLIINTIKTQKYHFYKEYTAIVSFMPYLKLHDVVIIYNDNKESIITIDYTPLLQDNTIGLINLFTGKNVPANIRIRKLKSWHLDKWYQTKPISIDDIYDFNLRKHLLTIQNKWNNNKKEMNLYKHNCKHFSHFVVNYLSTLDSFFKERL